MRRAPAPPSLLLALLACAPLACGAPPASTPTPTDLRDPAVALARLAREPANAGPRAPESEARRTLMSAIRRAPADQALPALRSGLVDPAADLREAAALAAGRRRDGATLAPELLAAATSDPEPRVRVAATRSLGTLRHADAFAPLQTNLAHEAPTVRLSALRALARIDPTRAAALPDLARLQLDPDSRVAGAATKISRGVDLY